jgi:hypothetical protein
MISPENYHVKFFRDDFLARMNQSFALDDVLETHQPNALQSQ